VIDSRHDSTRRLNQLSQLINDSLLGIGRNRRFDFFHGEDDVLLVLGDLRQHRQDQHVDRAGALAEEGRGVIAIAGGDEGGHDLAQMLTREVRHLEVRLHTPFARHIFLQRLVDAVKHAGNADRGVACHVEGGERADRAFPHLRPNFLQPQDDVEQAAMLQAQCARASAKGAQETWPNRPRKACSVIDANRLAREACCSAIVTSIALVCAPVKGSVT
jgi:hypothetical protein